MSKKAVVAAFTLLAICGAASAGAGDGIELTLDGPKTQLTLDWTGGAPSFQILRGTNAAEVAQAQNVRALTDDDTWTEDSNRPPASTCVFYLVTETDLEPGGFAESWINGVNCASEPQIQVHQYNENTFILRQSICTNFEGPFIYLLFGEDKVLMEDTGAGGIPIAATVYAIIDQWLFDHGKSSIQLIVAHSHGHGDHVAGDGQFVGQPDTTVVGLSVTAVSAFFGITNWPDQIVEYDLGGRVVDVIPIPGHQVAHIAFYDRETALLLTGDTLYPGRLYIFQSFPQYVASTQRMASFIATRPVVWVLGTHIEMSQTPYEDFPIGSPSHPNEHELELRREHLLELKGAVEAMGSNPVYQEHVDFIIVP